MCIKDKYNTWYAVFQYLFLLFCLDIWFCLGEGGYPSIPLHHILHCICSNSNVRPDKNSIFRIIWYKCLFICISNSNRFVCSFVDCLLASCGWNERGICSICNDNCKLQLLQTTNSGSFALNTPAGRQKPIRTQNQENLDQATRIQSSSTSPSSVTKNLRNFFHNSPLFWVEKYWKPTIADQDRNPEVNLLFWFWISLELFKFHATKLYLKSS